MAHSATESDRDRSLWRVVCAGTTGTMATAPVLRTPRRTRASSDSRLGSSGLRTDGPGEQASSSAHPSAISALSRLRPRSSSPSSICPATTSLPQLWGAPARGIEDRTNHPSPHGGRSAADDRLRSPIPTGASCLHPISEQPTCHCVPARTSAPDVRRKEPPCVLLPVARSDHKKKTARIGPSSRQLRSHPRRADPPASARWKTATAVLAPYCRSSTLRCTSYASSTTPSS